MCRVSAKFPFLAAVDEDVHLLFVGAWRAGRHSGHVRIEGRPFTILGGLQSGT